MNARAFRYFGLTALIFASSVDPQARAEDAERLPQDPHVVELTTFPETIAIDDRFAYRQIVVTARLRNGDEIDVTRIAKIAAPEEIVNVDDRGLVRPVADGVGELTFAIGEKTAVVAVTVNSQQEARPVSYIQDVAPAMSKMGCNQGTCHGAQAGKNGFILSLRGYDPIFDHRALTDDLLGRRFNRAAPERSLMLGKMSGEVPHGGGVLAEAGTPYYEILRSWIADGVQLDLDSPRVESISVYPPEPVVPMPNMKQQMAVIATFADGAVRDVTAEAFLESSNTETATVDSRGLVTAIRRGETAMLARYEGRYAAAPVVVMGDRDGYKPQETPAYNYVDDLVYKKLDRMKILPSGLSSDAEFLRRAYLDLIGLPPSPEQVREFLSDSRPSKEKRDELVDRLVGSHEYVEYWTNKWADLLQVNRKFLGERGAWTFRNWIRQAVASNMPYDEFARKVLASSGSTVENPPAAYYKILRAPDEAMENTTQLFLGIRFNCNKCHDHPFERWNQDQYYELAAYFAQVGRKADPNYPGQLGGTAVEGGKPLVEIIHDTNTGAIKNERTNLNAAPKFPFEHEAMPDPTLPRRRQLAEWVAAAENPYFAKSYVNRIWSYLLGVGLIEPVDDIRAGNPPSNPELLDRLTEDFIASGWDVQHLMRTICKSRVYQHSVETNRWNVDDQINYSHALARRLPAETLYDAVHRATGSEPKLPGVPSGFRAAQLLDSNVEVPGEFLDLFGRPSRESACECERSSGMMLGPVLNLVNGPVIAEAIRDPNNRLTALTLDVDDDEKLIEEIFLSILCREPSESEVAVGLEALQAARTEFEELQRELNDFEADLLPARQREWEKAASQTVQWQPIEPTHLSADKQSTLTLEADKSVFVSGPNQTPEIYRLTAPAGLKRLTAIRLEALADDRLPAKGPGRAQNGNFVLNRLILMSEAGEESKEIRLSEATADFSQNGWPVAAAIDGSPGTGWAVSPQFGKDHVAVFKLLAPLELPEDARLSFALEQNYRGGEHNLGRFRIAVTDAVNPINSDSLPENVVTALKVPHEERSDQQRQALADYYRTIDPRLKELDASLVQHRQPGGPRLLGVQDLAWALINSPAFLFNH